MDMLNRVIGVICVVACCLASFLRAEEAGPEKQSVWSTVELQFYGFVKLDAAYDTGPANPGNFVRWIELEPDNDDDDQFTMTANQTRLGLWLRGADDDDRSLATWLCPLGQVSGWASPNRCSLSKCTPHS